MGYGKANDLPNVIERVLELLRIFERRLIVLRTRNALHQQLPALQVVENVAEHLGVLRIEIPQLGGAADGRRTATGRHTL